MTARHWIGTAGLVTATVVIMALLSLPRYQIAVASGDNAFAFKLDNWTGATWFCAPHYRGADMQCQRLNEPYVVDFDELDAAMKQQQKPKQ